MFIEQCSRSAAKPACISAQSERARARWRTSRGQSALSGNFSARYSAMASVSHTAKPSSTSTGTRPAGLTCATVRLKRESGVMSSKRT